MWCECSRCKQPVLLDPDKQTSIIEAAKVNQEEIDNSCAILLSHCPCCTDMAQKGPADAFVVRFKEAYQ